MICGSDRGWVPACAGTTVWGRAVYFQRNDGGGGLGGTVTGEQSYERLARMVRRARLSKGLTQRQMSRLLRMSEGYAGHLERGGIRPNVDTLKSLAAVLGLVYGELAVAAGYISRQEYESPIDDHQLARLTEIGDLTEDEWESVRDFARYVRSKRVPESPPDSRPA